MPLFQNEANAIAAWLSGEGLAPTDVETKLVEVGERRHIHFEVELAATQGRTEEQEQLRFEDLLEDSYAETFTGENRIQPSHLCLELGIDIPNETHICQRKGCEENGTTYFIPPSRLFGIDNLFCEAHAEGARRNFMEPPR